MKAHLLLLHVILFCLTCHCNQQLLTFKVNLDSLYRAVCGQHVVLWISGLHMSALWTQWPVEEVGLWSGQANTAACYWWDSEWTDPVKQSWGPLLCHSSSNISSCGAWIIHSPVLQGPVAGNIPVLPRAVCSQDMWSMFGMLWVGVRQRVPVPASIQQLQTTTEEKRTNIRSQ